MIVVSLIYLEMVNYQHLSVMSVPLNAIVHDK